MYPLANMLVQIRNAQAIGQAEVIMPFSNLTYEIAEILRQEGFLAGVEKKNKKGGKTELPVLAITLKDAAISGVRLVSKPSRRLYVGKRELGSVKSGFGISVVTTSRGIMTGRDAKKAGIGGEVLFEIW